MNTQQILTHAESVLRTNDAGSSTRPAPDMYPHQWLWDSAFIAIGLAHIDPMRAAQEIQSLLAGQWENGRVPHMIFARQQTRGARSHNIGAKFWNSQAIDGTPSDRKTSGITQPPMLAESCLHIAQRMNKNQQSAFLGNVMPRLIAYHEWLYRERDQHGRGLVTLFHPWETGLDNTPGWMQALTHIKTPPWIQVIEKSRLDTVFDRLLRKDLQHVKSDERMSTANALRLTSIALQLKKHKYNSVALSERAPLAIESLSFNAILLGNNQALRKLASMHSTSLPRNLRQQIQKAEAGLEKLWNKNTQSYGHYNARSGQLMPVEGIAQLLPLYSGAISQKRADQLVKTLTNDTQFWLKYPVPSVSRASADFSPNKYWQGPTWVNTNWLIVQGLRKYGYHTEANHIKKQTIALYEKHGSYEYFSPLTGQPLGSPDFSWTAALVIDLIKNSD